MSQEAVGFEVRGQVQGVGFRFWARSLANRLGIEGTIRNRADGAVEVHARGAPEALARFEAALQEGPPAGTVTAVARVPAPAGQVDGFRIIH